MIMTNCQKVENKKYDGYISMVHIVILVDGSRIDNF